MPSNPAYSPEINDGEKEMQETMVRCVKEANRTKRQQCQCWGVGTKLTWKTALEQNR